jgi:hypothetical protein
MTVHETTATYNKHQDLASSTKGQSLSGVLSAGLGNDIAGGHGRSVLAQVSARSSLFTNNNNASSSILHCTFRKRVLYHPILHGLDSLFVLVFGAAAFSAASFHYTLLTYSRRDTLHNAILPSQQRWESTHSPRTLTQLEPQPQRHSLTITTTK